MHAHTGDAPDQAEMGGSESKTGEQTGEQIEVFRLLS